MSGSSEASTSRQIPGAELIAVISSLQRLILPEHISMGSVRGLGGYADVYDGTLFLSETNTETKVAVKRFRVLLGKEEDFTDAFAREMFIWVKLRHENVLPLIGMVILDDMPALVSDWMENGTMTSYLKTHEGVDILELARGIACGLEYLHDVGVVHSDLKGDNVLISHDGRPVLSDFGISRLLVDSKTFLGTTSVKGNTRWMAPELISLDEEDDAERIHHTRASDVWAFGMVEALSGKVPFYTKQAEGSVILLIKGEKLPIKPEASRARGKRFDVLWRCCCECWKQEPKSRPMMSAVRGRLKDPLFIETITRIPGEWRWVSPTGRFLTISEDNEKSITFLETRTLTKWGPGLRLASGIGFVAWSNTEEHVVTGSDDGLLRKWSNILEVQMIIARSKQGHEYARIEFSLDDRFIMSVWLAVKLWDTSDLSLIWQYPGSWLSVAFHPLGNRLTFSDWFGTVLDVNIEDLGNITTAKHTCDLHVYDLVFGPNGNTCVTKTDRGFKILNGDTFKETNSLPIDDCRTMHITPDGNRILFVLNSKRVVLWDIAGSEAVEELSLPVDLESVDYWFTSISKNCLAVRLISSTRGTKTTHVLHLTSSYY